MNGTKLGYQLISNNQILKGWILTPFRDEVGARMELGRIGVKVGRVKEGSYVAKKGGVEFEFCEVSPEAMIALEPLWGTYIWGLVGLPETPDEEDEEETNPGKIIDFHHKIWLQTDDPMGQEVRFSDLSEVSWAPDQIDQWDIPYISEESHLTIVRRLQLMLKHRYQAIRALEEEVGALYSEIREVKQQIPKPQILEEIRERVNDNVDLITKLRRAIAEMGMQLHGYHSNVGSALRKDEWSTCRYSYCKDWYDLAHPQPHPAEEKIPHPQEIKIGDLQHELPGLEAKINHPESRAFVENIRVQQGDQSMFVVMVINIGGLKANIPLEADEAFETGFKLLIAHQQIKNEQENR
jgi:hypothetical protein